VNTFIYFLDRVAAYIFRF